MAAINTPPWLPITLEQFTKACKTVELEENSIPEIYNKIMTSVADDPIAKNAIEDNEPLYIVVRGKPAPIYIKGFPKGESWSREMLPRRWYLVPGYDNLHWRGAEKQIRRGFSFSTDQPIAYAYPVVADLHLPFDEIKTIRALKGAPHLLWPEPSLAIYNVMITPWGGVDMVEYLLAKKHAPFSYTLVQVLTILHCLAESLEWMHNKDHSPNKIPFVFQDLKPENILITAQEEKITSIKIIDYSAITPEGPIDGTISKRAFSPFYTPTNAIKGHYLRYQEMMCADDIYAAAKIAIFAFNGTFAIWIGDIETQLLHYPYNNEISSRYLEEWRRAENPSLMTKAQNRISSYYNCSDLTTLLEKMLSENAEERPIATELKNFCCESLKTARPEGEKAPPSSDFWVAGPEDINPHLPSRIRKPQDILPWVRDHKPI